MKAIIELQFLPPVQYFTKLLHYPAIELEQWEHYQKRSYRNRCHIADSHGVQRLSIPLKKGKNEQLPIREVHIAYDQPWQKQLAHTIRTAYQRAPFFEEYGPFLLDTISRDYEFLFELNLELLAQITQFLGITPGWTFSDTYSPTPDPEVVDLRNHIRPVHPPEDPHFKAAYYSQLFEDKHGFSPNLSIIDLLFCMGPEALTVLQASSVFP
ncbi:MAG: WbqC family protein [Saprospirales bacterium]|nr:WbqC family protein [Saprospirales bacterium]MBK8492505.1 WbqC family protein [Saprospirales bacterium]